MVGKKPLDYSARVALSSVLIDLEDYAEAERYLIAGMNLHPNPRLCRAAASFYVTRFDDAPTKIRWSEAQLIHQLDLLKQAIKGIQTFWQFTSV